MISRKGSMQLGIEAIIILVIAMVLLGTGIAFITKMLGQGSDSVGVSLDAAKIGCTTHSEKRIVVSPEDIEKRTGEKLSLSVCAYADKNYNEVKPYVSCEPNTLDARFKQSKPTAMPKDTSANFKTLFTAPDAPGDYVCTIEIKGKPQTGTGTYGAITTMASQQVTVVIT